MPAELDEERLSLLFLDFLAGDERGLDREHELLEAAGPLRDSLAAKIRLHRELEALGELDAQPVDAGKQRLGRFEILGSLGQGGIGRVLLAFDPKLGRRIALKLIERESLLDKGKRAWILNEARGLAAISHPSVVKVYEVGEAGPHTYVAMELLTGPSLADVIAELARRREESSSDSGEPTGSPSSDALRAVADRLGPYSRRIELLAELAEALVQCHDRGILHRDVKPRNVLYDAEGQGKLIDFGLAHVRGADEDSRLGLTQSLVGTPAYLAPEQVTSKRTGADPRSDQFSFATLAYELIALENPFERETQLETKLAVEDAEPPPLATKAPAVPPDLALVLCQAHARDPALRYPGMAAFASDLRAILANRPVSVEEPSLLHVGRLWLRRHRRGVLIGCLALFVGLFLAGTSWVVLSREEHQELLDGLQVIRPEEFTRVDEFVRSFEPLLDLKQRARAIDSGWMRSHLWGATVPEVDRVLHSWASQLGQSYARVSAESKASNRPFQEILYRRLFAKEEVLCAECTENLEYRRRGTVRYPMEQLARRRYALDQLVSSMASKDPYSLFMETTLEEYPVPGTYRLQVWKEGGDSLEYETVFFVEGGWPPQVLVDLVHPRKEVWDRAVPIEFGPSPLLGKEPFLVPEFRVLPGFVTVGDYRKFQEATGYRGAQWNTGGSPPDTPAVVDLLSAMAFAHWAGGRLPFLQELKRAEEAGVIKLLADSAISGEHLLDLSPLDPPTTHHWLDYEDMRSLNRGGLGLIVDDRQPVSRGDPRRGVVTHVGFRVVFSADHPETYRKVSTAPFGNLDTPPSLPGKK